MSYGASKKSVSAIVASPMRRMARAIPSMKSVYIGLGNYPRGTMRQSNGLPSVDGIQVNPAFQADPADPTPG